MFLALHIIAVAMLEALCELAGVQFLWRVGLHVLLLTLLALVKAVTARQTTRRGPVDSWT